MNAYKKTIITLGIALVTVPQAFAMEATAKRNLETAYKNHFAPLPNFNTDKSGHFITWNSSMADLINIAKDNGGNDAVLGDAINKLLVVNANFIGGMKAGYALFAQKPNPSALEKSKIMILFSNNGQRIAEATAKLRKETYLLPGKRKAKDILLFIFDQILRGNTAAENTLNK